MPSPQLSSARARLHVYLRDFVDSSFGLARIRMSAPWVDAIHYPRGAALLATGLILAGGFFVFALAHMQSLQSFGLLSGASTLAAFLADLLLAPALLILTSRAVRKR